MYSAPFGFDKIHYDPNFYDPTQSFPPANINSLPTFDGVPANLNIKPNLLPPNTPVDLPIPLKLKEEPIGSISHALSNEPTFGGLPLPTTKKEKAPVVSKKKKRKVVPLNIPTRSKSTMPKKSKERKTGKQIKCTNSACTLHFPSQFEMDKHYNQQHETDKRKVRHYCDHPGCRKSYAREGLLKEHKNQIHSGKKATFQCKKCTAVFDNSSDLDDHKRKTHGAQCPRCLKWFTSKNRLIRHLKVKHPQNVANKEDSDEDYEKSTAKVSKRKRRRSRRKIQADAQNKIEASETISQRVIKKRKLANNTNKNKNKTNDIEMKIENAMEILEEEEEGDENLSSKKKKKKKKNRNKKDIKEGEKEEEENIGMEKIEGDENFNSEEASAMDVEDDGDKKEEEAIDDEEMEDFETLPDFKCGECGKTWRRVNEDLYRSHLEKAHGPFVCLVRGCRKVFAQWGGLYRHRTEVHAKKKGFQCNICRRQFKRRYVCVKHMISLHGMSENKKDEIYALISRPEPGEDSYMDMNNYSNRRRGNMDFGYRGAIDVNKRFEDFDSTDTRPPPIGNSALSGPENMDFPNNLIQYLRNLPTSDTRQIGIRTGGKPPHPYSMENNLPELPTPTFDGGMKMNNMGGQDDEKDEEEFSDFEGSSEDEEEESVMKELDFSKLRWTITSETLENHTVDPF